MLCLNGRNQLGFRVEHLACIHFVKAVDKQYTVHDSGLSFGFPKTRKTGLQQDNPRLRMAAAEGVSKDEEREMIGREARELKANELYYGDLVENVVENFDLW